MAKAAKAVAEIEEESPVTVSKSEITGVEFQSSCTVLNLGPLKKISASMCKIIELPCGGVLLSSKLPEMTRTQKIPVTNIACIYFGAACAER